MGPGASPGHRPPFLAMCRTVPWPGPPIKVRSVTVAGQPAAFSMVSGAFAGPLGAPVPALNPHTYMSKECGLLGRRQAVRHWILIPAFEGSIPSAPATIHEIHKSWRDPQPFARAQGVRLSERSTGSFRPQKRTAPHPFRPSQHS